MAIQRLEVAKKVAPESSIGQDGETKVSAERRPVPYAEPGETERGVLGVGVKPLNMEAGEEELATNVQASDTAVGRDALLRMGSAVLKKTEDEISQMTPQQILTELLTHAEIQAENANLAVLETNALVEQYQASQH